MKKSSKTSATKNGRVVIKPTQPAHCAKHPSKFVLFLQNLYKILLILLAPALFFSYYPIISFGSDHTMNYELSLPLLLLLLFDLVAFANLICCHCRAQKNSRALVAQSTERVPKKYSQHPAPEKRGWGPNLPGISDRRFFLFSLFPFYITISLFWSENPLRGLLTAGIVWALFFAVFAILFITPLVEPSSRLRRAILSTFFITTALVCLFCFIQAILDVLGVPRAKSLLCAGCTYRSFGFPHPSGFAIEPQFMGNLLLAPTLLALYFLCFQTSAKSPKISKITLAIFATLFSVTLFFTFSRGAIYAYALALGVLVIFALIKRVKSAPKSPKPSKSAPQLAKITSKPTKTPRLLPLIAIPIATFCLSLALQGVFAVVAPTSDAFTSAVAKSLNHLSLGIINLRPDTASETQTEPTPATAPTEVIQPQFDGYVAASTNIRLDLNSAALQTWASTPKTVIFGVGFGGAGQALYRTGHTATPKEIIQNEPLSLLLELGIVGAILVIFTLFLAFIPPIKSKSASRAQNSLQIQSPANHFWCHPTAPLFCALILAYLATLQFFSGLPNALHIYLLPPLLYLVL